MTTLNTIEDFLRVIREDAEIRAAVRRELLTDELLALPERVSALAKSFEVYRENTDRRFEMVIERLDEHKEDTDRRFEMVIERMDEQKEDTDRRFEMVIERMDEQKEDTDRRFDVVINRLDRQHEMYRRQHKDMGRFRGNYAISAARNSDGEIAGLFARLRGMGRILQVRRLDRDELDAMLSDNLDTVEALGLRNRVGLTFPRADIIAEITDRRNPSPGFYIAVEASYTGDAEDFLRATEHAKILRSATGQDAYAVVAGVRMGPSLEGQVLDDIEEFVAGNDEDTAFWYQIEEDELEPPDPCQGKWRPIGVR